jgi:hypothetical protein
MKNALIAILLCGVAVAACEDRSKKAEPATDVAIEGDWNAGADSGAGDGEVNVNIHADAETGALELKLPGGIEGTLKLPKGLDGETRFDLDGIGRYPGAKLTDVDIKARANDAQKDARVVLGFAAPGSADAVADWYEQALVKDGRSVSRTGTTVTTTTEDGKPMVIAVQDGKGGTAQGRITITDRKG